MEVLQIRHKVILDAMLDELNLPRSAAETTIDADSTAIVTVTFFPSAMSLHQSTGQYLCQSNPRNSVRDAENEAVHEAIQYLECCERKTPRDYSYDRLQEKKESEAYLLRQVAKKDEEIQQLRRNCSSIISGICGPSEKIEKIIRENLCEPDNEEEYKINSTLLGIEKAASDLKQLTFRSADLLQAAGTRYHGMRSFDGEFVDDTYEGFPSHKSSMKEGCDHALASKCQRTKI